MAIKPTSRPPVTERVTNHVNCEPKTCSMLEGIVNTASSHTSRLHATLSQLNTIEDQLIGSPVSDCGVGACDSVKGRPPLLVELQNEQAEASRLLDEIGFTLDRISDAVRK